MQSDLFLDFKRSGFFLFLTFEFLKLKAQNFFKIFNPLVVNIFKVQFELVHNKLIYKQIFESSKTQKFKNFQKLSKLFEEKKGLIHYVT